MRAGPIVIFHVTEQQVTEVALAEYNNVVKAFPSDRTHQPFSISIFPGGAWRSWLVANAHRSKASDEDIAIGPGHAGLSDIDAELEEFSMDPRRSPQRIGNAHLADKLAYLSRYSWSAPTAPRLPPPVRSEPGAVPFNHGLRLHDRHRSMLCKLIFGTVIDPMRSRATSRQRLWC